MYALIKDNKVQSYPISVFEWRQQNPRISLPMTPTQAQLNAVGIYEVEIAEKPVLDATHIVEQGPVEQIDGKWTQTWITRLANQPE